MFYCEKVAAVELVWELGMIMPEKLLTDSRLLVNQSINEFWYLRALEDVGVSYFSVNPSHYGCFAFYNASSHWFLYCFHLFAGPVTYVTMNILKIRSYFCISLFCVCLALSWFFWWIKDSCKFFDTSHQEVGSLFSSFRIWTGLWLL